MKCLMERVLQYPWEEHEFQTRMSDDNGRRPFLPPEQKNVSWMRAVIAKIINAGVLVVARCTGPF